MAETVCRLGRTQPAITLQLLRLEELSGQALLSSDAISSVRVARRAVPFPA
ncbi:hypothetical protein RDV64_06305 [Acuticoccus sp. MNP-M23]|uniref:hypothetical protein n=1 Tax=Acuticoccus sp. MNP-M23 TaxID=3072793 RepID=UPI002814ADF8|nr:hypothetical protein [Acuticoccus sp. MNP-M23]WMS44003.1 hypothetical protein RDV64_06305 [Acuticoccus sp. MNP-M23]